MTTRRRFVSTKSMEHQAKILAFLAARGSSTVTDVAAHMALQDGYVSSIMKHMSRHSRIHCTETQRRTQSGSTPTLWAAGKLPVAHDDDTDFAPQRVVISSTWQRGQAQRDSLVAALFGAAQQ